MFERFTKEARTVVKGAVGHAERLGAGSVTEEHLLLALLDSRGTRAAFAFTALGIHDRRESLLAGLADAGRRGGLSRADEAALADIGIDVAHIVSRVEEAHGEGAMRVDGNRDARRPSRTRFTSGAKKTLEQSLRVAVGRGDREITDGHMLLALTARPGVAADVLAEHGGTYVALERAMFGT